MDGTQAKVLEIMKALEQLISSSFFENEEKLIGQPAKRQAVTNAGDTILPQKD